MPLISARSSVDRVTVSEAGGRRFKSRRAHHDKFATTFVVAFAVNIIHLYDSQSLSYLKQDDKLRNDHFQFSIIRILLLANSLYFRATRMKSTA